MPTPCTAGLPLPKERLRGCSTCCALTPRQIHSGPHQRVLPHHSDPSSEHTMTAPLTQSTGRTFPPPVGAEGVRSVLVAMAALDNILRAPLARKASDPRVSGPPLLPSSDPPPACALADRANGLLPRPLQRRPRSSTARERRRCHRNLEGRQPRLSPPLPTAASAQAASTVTSRPNHARARSRWGPFPPSAPEHELLRPTAREDAHQRPDRGLTRCRHFHHRHPLCQC